jgi:regulator of replication initiation timing
MNDIINWVALNNTLMIRIGFSAVVLLLVVYAFRFFFMPSISVVASESSKDKESKDGADMHIEELAELQGEIDTLKAKLKEIQSAEPKTVTVAAPAASGGLDTVSAQPAQAEVNETAAKELKDKIKTLEARLSEYEIIAEEIAEIGKLRVENSKLKEMLARAPATAKPAEDVIEPVKEQAPSESAVSDSEIDALLGAVEENTAADAANPLAAEDAAAEAVLGGVSVAGEESISVTGGAEAAPEKELFIIHSEVEVTEEEKELIASFEQFKKV